MIVFSIAFGETFIRRLFERSLPSLLGDAPQIDGEPVSLAIFTLKRDRSIFDQYLKGDIPARYAATQRLAILDFDDSLHPKAGESLEAPGSITSGLLLEQAIKYCVEKDEPFVHAVPDLVYSRDIIRSCFALHSITGKIVSTFSGRVRGDLNNLEYLTAAESAPQLLDFFFEHMDTGSRAHFTTNFASLPGCIPGMLFLQTAMERLIFSVANPFMGRFQLSDALIFGPPSSFRAWDNTWQDRLYATSRIIAQTNLDAGFSIEPNDYAGQKKADKQAYRSGRVARIIGESFDPIGISQEMKFATGGYSLFTTSFNRMNHR